MLTLYMGWEGSLNRRLTKGPRPQVRNVVQAWMTELAAKIKAEIVRTGVKLGPQVVVDITMRFPVTTEKRKPEDYVRTILEGVEMGTGIEISNLIPFIRAATYWPRPQAGFIIMLFSADFMGHALQGRIEDLDGSTIIILDGRLSSDWRGARVVINLGVVNNG